MGVETEDDLLLIVVGTRCGDGSLAAMAGRKVSNERPRQSRTG